MPQLSFPRLIAKRVVEDWKLLGSVFAGMIVATTLAAGAPVYFDSLEHLAFMSELDDFPGASLEFNVFASSIALTEESIGRTEALVAEAIEANISPVYLGRGRYLRAPTSLVGLPTQPLGEPGETGYLVSRGHFHSISSLEGHSRFLEGRMAGDDVSTGPEGTVVEAVIGKGTAERLFCDGSCKIKLGDVVTLTPDVDSVTRISARIVGILEPDDPGDRYWPSAGIYPTPPDYDTETPPPRGVRVSSLPEPPVSLFVTVRTMFDIVGRAYPTTLINPLWFIQVDKNRLKDASVVEVRQWIDGFEQEVLRGLPGSSVTTANLRGLIDDVERRRFFSSVPLLLLLAIMLSTVFFFLWMMVSYLVQRRERDAALMRSRGAGTLQLLRLFSVEGLLMAGAAVAVASLLAARAVAAAGKLPQFRDIAGGDLLPVKTGPTLFLVALGVGLLCLTIYVIPGTLGARVGLLAYKLRASRPPRVPLFHRYYLDIAVMALGGLIFWEMNSRGQLISGGLFEEPELDETLLFAPVLFLIVVALLFMRFFPLLVRFVSGESAALLHMVVAGSVLSLAPAIAVRAIREDEGLSGLGPALLVLGIGGVYWAVNRREGLWLRMIGLALQAALVVAFIALEPMEQGGLLLAPTLALLSIVPGQLAFPLFELLARATPVWLSMSLLHMARNPMQYTWLVLLLVLATGLGIVTTTVGGTLERSARDRILYEMPADLRFTYRSSPLPAPISVKELRESQLDLPGVSGAALAMRTTGAVGPNNVEVLAMESRAFADISWYRDDFSSASLAGVMGALQSTAKAERVAIPEGATGIGAWIRPAAVYPSLFVWIVIEDSRGEMRTVSLGDVGEPEWHLAQGEIPKDLEPPLYLASVQLYEPGPRSLAVAVPTRASALDATDRRPVSRMGGGGSQEERGAVLFDFIHASGVPGFEQYPIEDFEGETRWTPIVTSVGPPDSQAPGGSSIYVSDSIEIQTTDAHEGVGSGILWFGYGRNRMVRGFYLNATDGPIPVVISSSLAAASGLKIGDALTVTIADRMTPVVVAETVDLFPTMVPQGGFILADLDLLLGYLNIFGQPTRLKPNELYVGRSAPIQDPEVLLAGPASRVFLVEDGAYRLESLGLDPFVSAGWRVVVFLSLGIVLLSAGFGYVAYLLLFSGRSRSEIGFLQSLGLSRLQRFGLLGFEHMAVAAIGLGLGTWAGLQMSRLTVSPLAVTETGEQVVPPFVLQMDWSLMLPTYAALVAVFALALVGLNRSVSRLDLSAIQRVEEY